MLVVGQGRSIILSKVGSIWIYVFLFAKQDRENIDDAELKEFRKLAKLYNAMKAADMDRLLQSRELVEICNG